MKDTSAPVNVLPEKMIPVLLLEMPTPVRSMLPPAAIMAAEPELLKILLFLIVKTVSVKSNAPRHAPTTISCSVSVEFLAVKAYLEEIPLSSSVPASSCVITASVKSKQTLFLMLSAVFKTALLLSMMIARFSASPDKLPSNVTDTSSPDKRRSLLRVPPLPVTFKLVKDEMLPVIRSLPPSKTRVSLPSPKSIFPVPATIDAIVRISSPLPNESVLLMVNLFGASPSARTSSSPSPIETSTSRVELDIVRKSLSSSIENICSTPVSLLLVMVELVTVTVSFPLSVKISPAGSFNVTVAPMISSISSYIVV